MYFVTIFTLKDWVIIIVVVIAFIYFVVKYVWVHLKRLIFKQEE